MVAPVGGGGGSGGAARPLGTVVGGRLIVWRRSRDKMAAVDVIGGGA